jgi:hypothetical protein
VASFELDNAADFQRLTDFMSLHTKTGEVKPGARPVAGEVCLTIKCGAATYCATKHFMIC